MSTTRRIRISIVFLSVFLLAVVVVAPACRAHRPAKAARDATAPVYSEVWRKTVELTGLPRLGVGAHAVFVASADSGVSAFSTEDGRKLWESSAKSESDVAVVGSMAAVISGGTLQAIDGESGKVAWSVVLEQSADATLQSVGDLFLTGSGSEIRAWKPDGTSAWRRSLPAPATTRIVTASNVLLLGTAAPALVALDQANGELKWQAPLPTRADSLTAGKDRIFLGGADGAAYAYRIANGLKREWRHGRMGQTIGNPAIDDRSVYFAVVDNSLRAFDFGGTQRWSHPLASRPMSGPVVTRDTVALLLANGELAQVPKGPAAPSQAKPQTNQQALRLSQAAVSADGMQLFAIVTGADATTALVSWRAAR